MSINILITSAGVSAAVNIIKSLRAQHEIEIKIISIDADSYAPGLHLSDKHYVSPKIDKPKEYFSFLYEIIEKHNITVLYPIHSREIGIVSENQEIFKQKGVNVLVPSVSAIELCNDKLKSSRFVDSLGIPVPAIISKPSKKDLPLFSKMCSGSGSVGATLVEDEYHLQSCMLSNSKRMYQEYVSGMEYTVDILCDKNSNVIIAAPRKRLSIKSGQCVKGITVNNAIIDSHVKKICKSVGLIGVCNIQFIERDKKYYFIEVNPRFASGGLMLTLSAGANLPLLALKIMLDISISDNEIRHVPNIVMTRYWEEIIIPEDSKL